MPDQRQRKNPKTCPEPVPNASARCRQESEGYPLRQNRNRENRRLPCEQRHQHEMMTPKAGALIVKGPGEGHREADQEKGDSGFEFPGTAAVDVNKCVIAEQ